MIVIKAAMRINLGMSFSPFFPAEALLARKASIVSLRIFFDETIAVNA